MIVVVMGVSGAGKSSVARAIATSTGWTLIEGDDLHPPENRAKMSKGIALDDDDRWPWLDAIAADARRIEAEGGSAVVACSALKRVYRERLGQAGPDVRFVHLSGSRDLIDARMRARTDHFMPPGLLDSQLATLEVPDASERAVTYDVASAVDDIVARALSELLA